MCVLRRLILLDSELAREPDEDFNLLAVDERREASTKGNHSRPARAETAAATVQLRARANG